MMITECLTLCNHSFQKRLVSSEALFISFFNLGSKFLHSVNVIPHWNNRVYSLVSYKM